MRKRLTLLALTGVFLLGACGDDIDQTARAADEDTDSGVVGDTAEDAQADPTTTTAKKREATTTTTAPKRAELELVDKGFFQITEDTTGYAALIRNPNTAEAASYVSVNISFFNEAGGVIGSVSDTFAAILPGQTVAIANGTDTVGVARMDVQLKADDWERMTGPVGTFSFEGVQTVPEEYGGVKTTGLLKSTFAEDLDTVELTSVYYDAGGAILGGTFTYADFVPANGSVGFELSTFNDIPNLAKTEVYAEITSLSLLGSD